MKQKHRRINIYLSEKLYESLRNRAHKEHKSISKIIREKFEVKVEEQVDDRYN